MTSTRVVTSRGLGEGGFPNLTTCQSHGVPGAKEKPVMTATWGRGAVLSHILSKIMPLGCNPFSFHTSFLGKILFQLPCLSWSEVQSY